MFEFKKFRINQDKCAMKVGTDGVLLGAWAPVDNAPFSILDIGTGTGVVALMLAQRTHAEQIDALEIDADAYEQATENFENSPWNDRLFCFHAGLDEFIAEPEDEYDLIVSNPPFHDEDYLSGAAQRDLARFSGSMPFSQLVKAADLLLAEDGIFAVIIPSKQESGMIELCKAANLYPIRVTRVKGTPESGVKRCLLAFSRTEGQSPDIDELIIETARHHYTEEYVALTRDFYLKM